MRFSSIQGRLILLLIAFCLLVIVSGGATFWSLEDQKRDASIINLAGRQRMLVQQMTREAVEMGMEGNYPPIQTLQEAIQTYETTLEALRYGGIVPYQPVGYVILPATQDQRLIGQLEQIKNTWQDYKVNLQNMITNPPNSPASQEALRGVENLSSELLQQSDNVVRAFESISTQKITRLRGIQAIFLGSAMILLVIGAWRVREDMILPLNRLGTIAKRIGTGDLETQVEVKGLDEIRLLEENLDQMRLQLRASQEKSRVWTDQLEQMVLQRTQELEALYTVSRDITSRLSIDDVLCSVTEKARELLNSDVAFLCLFNDSDQTMSLISSSGPEKAIARRAAMINSSTTRRVLAGERALRCDQGCRGYCEIVASAFRASHIAAPLKIQQQIIGALCVGSQLPEQFGEDAIDILTKLASVAAIAIQNARLYDQAERLATSEERQRIAAEMHDGLAQTLSYALLMVNQSTLQLEYGQNDAAGMTIQKVGSALNQAIEDTRRAIASLQEQGPLTETLQEQLARLVMDFSCENPEVNWFNMVNDPVVVSRQESQHILRVVREALLNASRHSRANQIDLCLDQVEDEYRLTVADDGLGFDPDISSEDNGRQHFGLNIMRARAARIGGRLDICSAPNNGTKISLYFPTRRGVA